MARFRTQVQSPALWIALVALFVALGGTGYAALQIPKNSVGSKQIKKNAVKSSDIAANAVRAGDVKDNALTGNDVDESKLGKVRVLNSAALQLLGADAVVGDVQRGVAGAAEGDEKGDQRDP